MIGNTGSGDVTHGFAKFNISTLPVGITSNSIDKATLRLWIRRVRDPGAIDIHLVTEAWTEGTTTFGSAPDIVAAPFEAAFPILDGAERVWTLIDITPEVQGWLDGVLNNGIAILPTDGSDIYIELDSKESGRNQVELEVSNVPPAPPAPIGSVGGPMGGQLIGGGTRSAVLSTMADEVIGMFHGGPFPFASLDKVGVPMPGEGSVTDLHIHLDGTPGSSDTYKFTVYNGADDTAVKCTVPSGDNKCKDDINNECFIEGDLIAIVSDPSPDPFPEARAMTWSAVFTPELCGP